MTAAGLTFSVTGGKALRARVIVPARRSFPTSKPRVASPAEAIVAALAPAEEPDDGEDDTGGETGAGVVPDVPLPEPPRPRWKASGSKAASKLPAAPNRPWLPSCRHYPRCRSSRCSP